VVWVNRHDVEVPVNDDDVDHYDNASPIVDASAAMAAVAAQGKAKAK
jgi:hypothetical protein